MIDNTSGGGILVPRAVLWDMDGTIADSGPQHWRTWHEAMAAHQRPLTTEQFAAAFGQRNDRFLRAWLGDDLSDAEVARIGDEKEAAYRALIELEGLAALPGVALWARRLKASGWRQAVASSAPRLNIEVMLRAVGLDDVFDAFVGAEDVTIGKPDPQIFLVAAAALGVPASRCIVVEDAAVGIEGARRAGMRSIGVSRTERLAADLAVESLVELGADAFDRLLEGVAQPASPGKGL